MTAVQEDSSVLSGAAAPADPPSKPAKDVGGGRRPPSSTLRSTCLLLLAAVGIFAAGFFAGKLLTEEEYYDPVPRGVPRVTDPTDLHYGDQDLLVRNANRSQPILQYMDNALPDDEFLALQVCMREHPMRHSNANDGKTFAGTKGFVLSFNEDGIEELERNGLFKCMAPFFHRHRVPVANAWVLNMVWADVTAYDRSFAIERHTDNALVLDYPGDGEEYVMPYQTSVLYISVPDAMVGGEIEAYPYESDWEDMDAGVVKPSGAVKPKENRMSYFPGDSWHQVRAYSAPRKDKLRASLVLESYNIPLNILEFIRSWDVQENENNQEMM